MIYPGLQVRHAAERDYDQIANLTYYGANIHRHLDWHSPLEWLGVSNYWVLEDEGRITAAFACPEDPPQVAWIRFFGYHPGVSASQAWTALWQMAYREMQQSGHATQVASIVVKPWFQSLLVSSGFELKQSIVMLELNCENARLFPASTGIQIRPMRDADMPTVAAVDLAAFGPFWHNTEQVLQKARLQCASATVAEDDSGVIGYQLSMKSAMGAHLARLAVKPQVQGRGAGAALISQLVQTVGILRGSGISVNTQSDNAVSLSLYKKIGFVHTGETFPVFTCPVGG